MIRSRLRTAVAAVAVLAVGTVGASSASAALPEFSPAGTVANPVHYTFKSSSTTEFNMTNGSAIENLICDSATGTGTITGSKALNVKYTFKGCALVWNNTKCSSDGAEAGEIKTGEIPSTLAYISKSTKQVGIVINHSGATAEFAMLDCGEKGAIRSGPIVPVTPINTKTKSLTMHFNVSTGSGHYFEQIPTKYENEEGKLVEQTQLLNLRNRTEFWESGMRGEGSMSGFLQAKTLPEEEVKA
jgi:hypothetical protein